MAAPSGSASYSMALDASIPRTDAPFWGLLAPKLRAFERAPSKKLFAAQIYLTVVLA
jgi:hypothetical protein